MPRTRLYYYLPAAVFLILVSLLIYGGVGDHELLNWDDRSYTVANPWVSNPTPSNIMAMFTEVRMGNWHPLTWLSFIPEYAACGDTALCYKLSNAVLHGINAFLIGIFTLVVLGQAGSRLQLSDSARELLSSSRAGLNFSQWAALFSAMLFLTHPQHVEAVTWVAERKELLCGLFYLLALIDYCQLREGGYRQQYGFAFLFFVLGLMSKSMAVSLPLMLVLLDLFLLHHQRLLVERDMQFALYKLVVEKLPFYLLMFGAMLLTLWSQTPDRLQAAGLEQKLLIVLAGLQHYPLRFLFPFGFSPFYPQEIVYLGMVNYMPALLLAAGVGFALFRARKSWFLPLLVLALLSYLLAVAPVVGIVKVGEQAFADRYSYLTVLSLYLGAGWIFAYCICKASHLALAMVPAGLLLVFVSLQSYSYKHVWRNDLAFWSNVVESYPDVAATPLDNLANSLSAIGEYQMAQEYYERSISINPQGLMAYLNLASVYDYLGDTDLALRTLERAVEANPDSAGLQSRAGRSFLLAGELQQGARYIEKAQQLQPNLADVQLSRGMLDLMRGDVASAIEFLSAVPASMPQHYEAGLLLVQALGRLDRVQAMSALDDLITRYGERPQLLELRESLNSPLAPADQQ